jgi:hypothetical protein
MLTPSNPNHGLDQIIREECLSFESWKKANDDLSQLRSQLMSTPQDHSQHCLLSSQIQVLRLKKNKYINSTTAPIYSSVTPPIHLLLSNAVQAVMKNLPTCSLGSPPVHHPISYPVQVVKN